MLINKNIKVDTKKKKIIFTRPFNEKPMRLNELYEQCKFELQEEARTAADALKRVYKNGMISIQGMQDEGYEIRTGFGFQLGTLPEMFVKKQPFPIKEIEIDPKLQEQVERAVRKIMKKMGLWNQLRPAYVLDYDPSTLEPFYRFCMDLPVEMETKAAILHKPSGMSDEQFKRVVKEAVKECDRTLP